MLISTTALGAAPPQTITLDGRLFDSTTVDSPLLDTNVLINVKILNPNKTCILYEENQTADTTINPGRFTIHVGSPVGATKRVMGSPPNSMATVFQNSTSILANAAGACPGAYSPAAGDVRYMRITVSPSATGVAEILGPDTVVESVPTAMVAETLQGLTPSQFLVLGAQSLTQTNVENVFSTTNYGRLTDLLSGSSPDYVRVTGGSATIPGRTSAPSTPTTGQLWFNTSTNTLQYYSSGGVLENVGTSSGSVSSVGLSLPSIFNVTTPTVTSSGTLTATLASQSAGVIFAGPATGGAAAPTFRAIASTDLPSGGYDSSYARVNGNTLGADVSLGTNDAFGLSFRTNGAVRMTITSSGAVGIGTATPSVALDVAGAVRVGTDVTSCSAALNGSLRNNGGVLEFCNGTTWSALASASGSIASIGGLTATTQLLSIGSSGLAPNWTSSGVDTHVLNIPMASSAGVTAGLVSKAELDAKLSSSLPSGNIWVGNSAGLAVAVLPSGDVLFSNSGATTVDKLRGVAVDTVLPTAAGQVLRYDATGAGKWTPAYLSMADIRSTTAGNASIFPSTNCPLSQTMTWSSLTDSFVCQNIQISSTQIVYASAAANLVFAGPATGASASPTFRSLVAADLPAGLYDQTYFKQNGNSLGATASLGTNDNNSLAFRTNGVNRVIATGNGYVGIGSGTPVAGLDINGTGVFSSVLLPRDSTANRPSGVNGMIRYNTTTDQLEAFTGNAWNTLATAAAGGYLPLSGGTMTGAINMGGASLIGSNTASGNLVLDSTSNASKGSIILNSTSGSVGIGTTTPTATLDVNGNGRFASAIFVGVNATVGSRVTTPWLTGATNNGGNLSIESTTAITKGTILIAASGGAVGIGTTTPTAGAVLDIFGIGTAASSVLLPRDTTTNRPTGVNGMIRYNTDLNRLEAFENNVWTSFVSSATAGYINGGNSFGANATLGTNDPYSLSFRTNSVNRMIIDGSGNVGIGTTTPRRALSVGSTLDIFSGSGTSTVASIRAGASGGLTINGSPANPVYLNWDSGSGISFGNGAGGANGTWLSNGLFGIGTTTPTALLDLVGTTTSTSAIILPRSTSATRPAGTNGMLRYNTDLQAMEMYSSGAWSSLVTSGGSGSSQWIASGSNIYYGSGNVGIGTSSTTKNINLSGASAQTIGLDRSTTGVGANLTISAGSALSGGSNLAGGHLILQSGTFTGNAASADILLQTPSNGAPGTGDRTPATRLKISGNNGYVSINGGLDPPPSPLTVSGPIQHFSSLSTAGTVLSAYKISALNSVSSPAIYSQVDGVLDVSTASSESGSLSLKTMRSGALTEAVRILGGGAVGIGTSTPSVLLDVNGTGTLSAILVPRDSTTNRPSGANGMIRYNTTLQAMEMYSSGAWASIASGGGSANQWNNGASSSINYTAGSVGIGTATPAEKLDVNGSINLPYGNYIKNVTAGWANTIMLGTYWDGTYDHMTIQPTGNSAGVISLNTASSGTATATEKVRIAADGKVGIGTSTPGATLDVYGGIRPGPATVVTAGCDATTEGTMRYNKSTHFMEYCNATAWVQIVNQVAGTTTPVVASGPPVGTSTYTIVSATGTYATSPGWGSVANTYNGNWPSTGTSATNNPNCVELQTQATSTQKIIYDLGANYVIGKVYVSAAGNYFNSMVPAVAFSTDGVNFVSSANLGSLGGDPNAYFKATTLGTAVTARYVRLTNAGSNTSTNGYATFCQIAVGP